MDEAYITFFATIHQFLQTHKDWISSPILDIKTYISLINAIFTITGKVQRTSVQWPQFQSLKSKEECIHQGQALMTVMYRQTWIHQDSTLLSVMIAWVEFRMFLALLCSTSSTFIWFLPLYSQDRQLRHMVLATLPRIPCAFGASDTRDDDCPKPNHTWKPGLRTNSSIFSEHDLQTKATFTKKSEFCQEVNFMKRK